jgi:holliday junction DNA helicase RuvA
MNKQRFVSSFSLHPFEAGWVMITKISGVLSRVLDEEVRLQVGPMEYQVLVPEFVRRQVQGRIGRELTLHTCHYFDGNPMQGRVVPRLIGFGTEADLEFFDLFCTVDKVGTRKALKALVRPVREIANAIQRQDAKWLTTLPGVGAATAEQIIATLRRKVTRFALATPTEPDLGAPAEAAANGAPATVIDGNVIEDAYQALLSLGHSPVEARNRLDAVLTTGRSYQTVEEVLTDIYHQAK